jgi:hypothetical protein
MRKKSGRGSFPQIVEAKITEGTGNLGQAIVAIETVTSLTGTSKQKWTIQCKHFPSRKVASSDIADIIETSNMILFPSTKQ